MFGYIKPFKPSMQIAQYEIYRSIYCGLCKQLSKSYAPFARNILSYDLTFLAMLHLALTENPRMIQPQKCMLHWFHKSPCALPCEELSYAADISVISAYYHLLDNIKDHTAPITSHFACFMLRRAHKKAAVKKPQLEKIFTEWNQKQSDIEKQKTESIDKFADPTANAIAKISASFTEDEKLIPVFTRFGYMLGRYIYFMDAFDDIEKDAKAKNFNPFLQKFPNREDERFLSYVKEMMYITIAQLASAYELLPIVRLKPILDNIIYTGLPNTFQTVLESKIKKPSKNKPIQTI